jgi:predicted nucleotidyltransferase
MPFAMTPQSSTHDHASNPIDQLAVQVGREWVNLVQARRRTREQLDHLRQDLDGLDNLDSSIVVFGSLARDEATHASDIDWTLLIDGKADPQHVRMAQEIRRKISADRKPGREGTFGKLAFSHEIVNCIGGEDDSNANTTRRILLLLESKPIRSVEAWKNVQKNILCRYIEEDYGLRSSSNKRGVPLFLLNDIARYWRTMVVDFAYKQRERENEGYALRSLKLGLSRKLIYASGILACFMCELNFPDKKLFQNDHPQSAVDYLHTTFNASPLEIIANSLSRYEILLTPAKRLFDAYDSFLGLMCDDASRANGKTWREHIESLSVAEIETDPLFQEARSIRNEFGEALKDIFLKTSSPIQNLMIERGIF